LRETRRQTEKGRGPEGGSGEKLTKTVGAGISGKNLCLERGKENGPSSWRALPDTTLTEGIEQKNRNEVLTTERGERINKPKRGGCEI